MSVRENLTLGRPDASDADVEEALRVAQADFVHDLPWGWTPASASRGCRCPAGSGSGSRWPAPCSAARRC